MNYPDRETAVQQILDIGRRLEKHGYVVANDGNLSCLLGPDRVLTTPTGVSKGAMCADMLVEMDLDGNILKAGNRAPSSEVRMHLRVYQENSEIGGVVHAHPMTATSFAAAGIALDEPILTESLTAIGSIPVAHFAMPGTQEVPDSIAPFCRVYNGTLLANHGVVTWAEDLETAFFRMEWVEAIARATLTTKFIMGQYNRLSCMEVAPFAELREKMGIRLGGQPMCAPKSANVKDVLPRSGMVEHEDEDPRAERIIAGVAKRIRESEALVLDELEADLIARIADRVAERITTQLKDQLADQIIARLGLSGD